MENLTCPKCQGLMRQYERSGIIVDQCSDCRGLFLDRGELEKLVDAEASWSARQAPSAAPAPAPAPTPAPQVVVQQHKPYRRKSFLEELFG